MTAVVELYDAKTIDDLVWPDGADAQRLKRYLLPVMREGPRQFVDNADVEMLALRVDDQVLPVVLPRGTPGNSCVCSPYSHYIAYAREEVGKLSNRALATWLRRGLSLLGRIVGRSIDRVVYVNNYLWVTNPVVRLSRTQVAAIVDRLVAAYPDRAVVFRNVDATTRGRLWRSLLACGFRMLASRKVYLVDGASRAMWRRSNIHKDFVTMRRTPYEVVGNADLTDADVARMTEVYRRLYLEKYPSLNPQFNERFFRLVTRARVVEGHGFRLNGRLDAFCANFLQNGVFTPPAIGYDITLPRKRGLYRMVVVRLIGDAIERRLTLNLSAGSGAFKRLRGGVGVVERDAVYDAHLPPHRRLAWWLMRVVFNRRVVDAFQD